MMADPPFIPERIKELRSTRSDLCWRPNATWTNVCIQDLGHAGRCGWDEAADDANSDLKTWTENGFRWSFCTECDVPVFEHRVWSHQGGTPPQDHDAEPAPSGQIGANDGD